MMESTDGRRERKRRETGERISQAALALFFKDGFEATTLDAIAEAADVSRRTVFHYFASKEAIVEAQEAQFEDALRTAAAQSSASAPLDAVQEAILKVIARYATEEMLAVERLMRASPQLVARKPAGWQRKERLLYEGLVARWPEAGRAPGLRLAAMAGLGAFRLASEAWTADGGQRSPAEYVVDAFERLKRELG